MKKTLEIQELRGKDKKALLKDLLTSRQKLTELRLGRSFGKVKNFHQITKLRKRIARLWTIMTEKSQEELFRLEELKKGINGSEKARK